MQILVQMQILYLFKWRVDDGPTLNSGLVGL